ncbi:DUF3953 domain-containing protein [Virgibacillus sediminis]|uniref:DUF3953 domain-containing protein n=1 Tax=Virgibacillus sediminis TaxID=202260 RepID=A0ABV7A4M3_9BACI
MIFQLIFFITIIALLMGIASLFNRRNTRSDKHEGKTGSGFKPLKILRVILAVIVVFIAGYEWVTENFALHSYMMFFLGLMMLVMGLDEFQKGRKGYGWISIVVFLLLLSLSFQ